MLGRGFAVLVRLMVASLIVGTILAHFDIQAEKLLGEVGLTPEKLAERLRQGLSWALPNLVLGSLVILPIWFVSYLFRPPGDVE